MGLRVGVLVWVTGLLVAGCGKAAEPSPLDPPLPPIEAAAVTGDPAAVAAMSDFGYRLYRASAAAGDNTVLSPLSISTAFGMARAGAGGATAAELDGVFGFPAEGPHAALNKLIRAIDNTPGAPPMSQQGEHRSAGQPPAPPAVNIANGFFVQNGLPVRDGFRNTLAGQYGAQPRAVDFRSDAGVVIDAWAREQTAGRIEKVFDQLDPATKVVLANAVYLKADWKIPFMPDATKDEAFTRADGGTVSVPMMHQHAALRYASGTGWQAVELPYAGDQLAMWILVPAKDSGPAELLAPATLAAVAGGLRPGAVDLAMPRWDFGSGFDLVAQLEKLGLRAPFGPGADFSGIADGAFLSQAVHRATVTVDEWGTEAAAVTATAMATSGFGGETVTVRADHPFAFAIVHTPTATPLFIGHVIDPSAHNR